MEICALRPPAQQKQTDARCHRKYKRSFESIKPGSGVRGSARVGGGGRESSPEAPGARAFIYYYFIFGPVSWVRRCEEQIGASGAPGSILIDWEWGVSTWRFHVTDVPSDSHLSFIIRAPPISIGLWERDPGHSRGINDHSVINGSISNPDC